MLLFKFAARKWLIKSYHLLWTSNITILACLMRVSLINTCNLMCRLSNQCTSPGNFIRPSLAS